MAKSYFTQQSFISSKHRISDILIDIQGNLNIGKGEPLLLKGKGKKFSNYVRYTLKAQPWTHGS